MASADTLCKKLLHVKNTVVESTNFFLDDKGVAHLRIQARANVWHKNDCPICGKRCPGYDKGRPKHQRHGEGLISEESLLKSNPLLIESSVLRMALSPQLFHGLIRGAALR